MTGLVTIGRVFGGMACDLMAGTWEIQDMYRTNPCPLGCGRTCPRAIQDEKQWEVPFPNCKMAKNN